MNRISWPSAAVPCMHFRYCSPSSVWQFIFSRLADAFTFHSLLGHTSERYRQNFLSAIEIPLLRVTMIPRYRKYGWLQRAPKDSNAVAPLWLSVLPRRAPLFYRWAQKETRDYS